MGTKTKEFLQIYKVLQNKRFNVLFSSKHEH